MSINRWIFLMFLVIVSGCGVPHDVHQQVLDQLATEKKNHTDTQNELTTEKNDHKDTQNELTTEKKNHKDTQNELTTEKNDHKDTQNELATEKKNHKDTQNELATEKNDHKDTQNELATEKKNHTDTQNELEAYRSLKLPAVDVYFNLGRIRVDLAIIKGDHGKNREAKELYRQAIVSLKKVIDIQPSADPYYYLARAYYELGDFVNACKEVKNALALAKGGHRKAEELKNALANCD